jgi:uncharacterized protein (TIGR02145 family)
MGVTYGLSSQDITVAFQPKHGGVTIDSILVTNQKTSQKIKLAGNESLTLTKITGIKEMPLIQEHVSVFPNPNNGNAEVSINNSLSQVVKIGIFNNLGQLLAAESRFFVPGLHKIKISLPLAGIYNILVQKSDGSMSYKAICLKSESSGCGIDYLCFGEAMKEKGAITGKTLGFTPGDNLLYSVFSENKNTYITDSPTSDKSYSVEFYECKDPDNTNYPAIKIGDQVWMAKNLAWLPSVNKQNDGSNTTSMYYVYDYNGTDIAAAKKMTQYSTYGVLYNWPAAKTACPKGWHLPTDTEWLFLESYLISFGYNYDGTAKVNKIAKSMAATTNWNPDNRTGTVGNNLTLNNKSGFTGLPGGGRYSLSGLGYYTGIVLEGNWWSSTEASATNAWSRNLNWEYVDLFRDNNSGRSSGISVRCVRD